MASIKVFSLSGLDQKSNDLTRPIDKASDMVNIEYDTQSTLKKRNGFAECVIDGASSASFNDIVYYNSKDEVVGFTNGTSSVKVIKKTYSNPLMDPLYPNSTTFNTKTIAFPSGVASMSNVSISYCENQNNLYFTNTDYLSYVMKYDGDSLIRSGLPTPRLSQASTNIDLYPTYTGSAAGFTRCFYSYKDINGNVVFSPYVQFKNLIATVTLNSLKNDPDCLENGFFSKYCYIAKGTAQTISSSSRTLNTTKHNYAVGDKFLIDTENKLISIDSSALSFIVLQVESVDPVTPGSSITFTAASFNSRTIVFSVGASYASEYPVDIRCKLYIATSSSEFTGYTTSAFAIDNSLIINTISVINPEQVFYGTGRPSTPVKFEDLYDSAYLKIMPPICKFIASYGDQIIYGSIQAYFSGSDRLLNVPNQRISFANTSLITFSDTSTGDGPEGTSDFNFTKIGETWDGDITGIRRCNDSLIIFKNRGVFSIDGTLISGQFSLRKINTNFVGCTSHKSILDADEGVYFQAHNGLYFTNGINVTKLSYEIDSLFLSGSYLNTKSVRLKKKQKSLFYVPDILNGAYKIVIVDYYYNQIYMWNSATLPLSGIIEDKNGDTYFCNGSKLFKFNDTYTDNGTAISSLYSTTWHHAGEPSLNKKWLSLRTFGLTNDTFTVNITTEGDWTVGTYLTNNNSFYSTLAQTDFKMLDMQTKKSLRINFSNSTNNENMVLTGYELTYEMFNVVDKN